MRSGHLHSNIAREPFTMQVRYGLGAGDWQLHFIIKPERPRPALNRVSDLYHLALVRVSVGEHVSAAVDPVDAGRSPVFVVVGFVHPSAQ